MTKTTSTTSKLLLDPRSVRRAEACHLDLDFRPLLETVVVVQLLMEAVNMVGPATASTMVQRMVLLLVPCSLLAILEESCLTRLKTSTTVRTLRGT